MTSRHAERPLRAASVILLLEFVELHECPLWVNSGQLQRTSLCPLYTRKQTCAAQLEMSALGQ